MKIAVFPGSFDPFTNGHLDVVRKSSELFDHVYVMLGVNINKTRYINAEDMKSAIEKTLKNNSLINCEVIVYSGLLIDFAKAHGAKYIVRGLRNSTDFEYEENMAEINCMLLPELEYIYVRSENSAISSSLVRELLTYKHSADMFLPEEINELTLRMTK